MNLNNAVYNFAVGLKSSAAVGTPLNGAVVHSDCYEEMNESGGTKFIRVDDLIGSTPQPGAEPDTLKEFNAVLDVQFLQIPVNQTLPERLAARETADAMALAFIDAMFKDQRLGTNNCNIIGNCTAKKMNGWRSVSGVKTPVSIVRLTMNKK